MKLLFLDFDGVINTLMIYDEDHIDKNKHYIHRGKYYYDLASNTLGTLSNYQAIMWINAAYEEVPFDIVLTTSWLIRGNIEDIKECLYRSGLSREIKIVGQLDYRGYNFGVTRGQLIERYLEENNLKPEDISMVILDDDEDMIGLKYDFRKYLVKCNTYVGVTFNEFCKIKDTFLCKK